MAKRRSSTPAVGILNSRKHWALAAIVVVSAATALVVWLAGHRVARPSAVAEREPEARLESAAPPVAREPRPPAMHDLAGIAPRPAPRTVSEQQASIAAEVLRGFPLDQRPLAEPITVLALMGDPEAAEYARQLAQVLNQGGWATTMSTTTVRYNGVMCLVDNAAQFPVHARALTFAFEQAGIACTSANNNAPPSNRIEIVVGSQPTG